MIPRRASTQLRESIKSFAAVAPLGPRQVGKTTLARELVDERGGIYLDLENETNVALRQPPT